MSKTAMGSVDDEERTALITGASSGIGLELTKLFAAAGFDVLLVARSEDTLAAVAGELETDHGVTAEPFPTDLARPDAARELYERVTEAGFVVDALVNNAGYGVYGEFVDTDLDAELDMIRLHVRAVTVLTKLFGREMADRGDGYILNNASVAGFAPLPTSTVYSAAKHYERAFSEALAEEFADEGVTVTALCPGETDTGFMQQGNFEEAAYEDDDLMDPKTVARAGFDGLMDGDRVVVPGLENKLNVFLGRLLPRKQYVKAAKRAQNE
jgi:short-subunit dehydrogenase